MVLLNTLSSQEMKLPVVLEFYRARWQVELAFKRLKSLLQMGQVPKKKASCRAWMQGKILTALLIQLEDIEPITVAAYIETLQRQAAPPTVKQHMAAIRMLFSWLTEKGVLAMNPAREVKTERFSRTEGKTPAFVEGEVQKLLGVIETSTHTGLRDRALLGVLAYTFARIGAVVNLKVEDYYPSGKRFLLRFKEKGGKEKELPVHHKLEELLDQYLKASGLEKEPGSPLFPASIGKTGKLSRRPLVRTDAADMLKRRLKQAGLPAHYSPHSFRATGITNFLENDGTLEAAQRIAGHADSRTTKLYDRRGQKVLLEDMERIRY